VCQQAITPRRYESDAALILPSNAFACVISAPAITTDRGGVSACVSNEEQPPNNNNNNTAKECRAYMDPPAGAVQRALHRVANHVEAGLGELDALVKRQLVLAVQIACPLTSAQHSRAAATASATHRDGS
jgi:hypothetical protein